MPGAETMAHPAVGLGVDLVAVDRLRSLVQRRGEAVLDRLLTSNELDLVRGARGLIWTSVAGRFAAKEATKKLLGSCGELARWTEVEILPGRNGEPRISLHGSTRQAARRCGVTSLAVSISHEKTHAIAVVLGW